MKTNHRDGTKKRTHTRNRVSYPNASLKEEARVERRTRTRNLVHKVLSDIENADLVVVPDRAGNPWNWD